MSESTPTPTPLDIVTTYLNNNWPIVTWPANGDDKGPQGKDAKGWTQRQYSLDDYQPGYRVGIKTGSEVQPGHYLIDVDIDWAPGRSLAARILPATDFVFGRPSKPIAHCFYTTSTPLPLMQFTDIDDSMLIELRGTRSDGEVGLQTMVPPSIWSKNGSSEPLAFASIKGKLRNGTPAHIDEAEVVKNRVIMVAISMLLTKHLGKNGFGHDTRLAWAGFLLRLGFSAEDIIVMGEAISYETNNLEVSDVRRVVETTQARLKNAAQKIKGGPAFAKVLGDKGKAIVKKINDWMGRESDFIRTTDGGILKESQENVKRAINLLGINLMHNEFSDKMLIERDGIKYPLEDKEVIELWMRIDDEYRFRPTFNFFKMVLQRLAWQNSYHPVKDYLSQLEWDGTPRIDKWLHTYGGAVDNEYTRAVSSMVLIAAVRRVKHPGCKFDEMLVLESSQGKNKSSALAALCPKREWFSDDLALNVRSQQMIEATLGKWIVEAADLAGKRKTEVEQLKATLSRQVDGPARMAYAHFPVERPRQFVIIGTTNSGVYLNDSTGARRFWPVRIENFDIGKLKDDRDQLWAEAAHREGKGERIRLREDLWEVAGVEQEERREMDAWEDQIEEMISMITPASDGSVRIVTSAIWDVLGIEVARRDRVGSLRIAEIMYRLNFSRTRVKEDGKTVVGYTRTGTEGQSGTTELPAPRRLGTVTDEL